MKSLKHWIVVLALMIVFVVGIISSIISKAAIDDTTVDFVLVLDCSGSMESSDSERLSIIASKLLVEMLPVENTRVGVISFGRNDGVGETYVYGEDTDAVTYTKLVYELSDVGSQKEEVKQVITDIAAVRNSDENNTYSTVGYALAAAYDMLERNNSKSDQACILFMSDGRLWDNVGTAGKDLYESDGYINSHALDETLQSLANKQWSVYSMELAFDAGNNSDFRVDSGKYQMQRIADETDGEKITITSTKDARQAFGDIFAKFFDLNNSSDSDGVGKIDSVIIENGFAEKSIHVEEMTAEMNISITGSQIEKITSVELIDADGKSTQYTSSESSSNCIVNFEKGEYVVIKLLQPKQGTWTVKVYGADGVEVEFMSIPMREVNFQLSASKENGMTLNKGDEVIFTANFVYNDNSISSSNFYKSNPAVLELVSADGYGTGQKYEMKASEDNYSVTINLEESGTYNFRAYVENAGFRNEKKVSGIITFYVDNTSPSITANFEDVELSLGESKEIDCSLYFKDPDGDAMAYRASIDGTSGVKLDMEDSILKISSGTKAGEYKINVTANDGSLSEPLEQSFLITIKNQPLVGKGSDTIEVNVNYNAESMPGILKKLFGLDGQTAAETLNLNDYFEDPDQLPIQYEILNLKDNGIAEVALSGETTVLIQGLAKGDTNFQVVAVDASDSAVSVTKNVEIHSINTVNYIWKECGVQMIFLVILILVILVVIILAMPRAGIYGVWNVYINNVKKSGPVGFHAKGKVKQCSVDEMLAYLGIKDKTGSDIKMKNGNSLSKAVIFQGLEAAVEVEYEGNVLNSADGKIKPIAVKSGEYISMKVGTIQIRFERK